MDISKYKDLINFPSTWEEGREGGGGHFPYSIFNHWGVIFLTHHFLTVQTKMVNTTEVVNKYRDIYLLQKFCFFFLTLLQYFLSVLIVQINRIICQKSF